MPKSTGSARTKILEILSKIVLVAMLVFVVSSMLAMGLSLTVREIVAPLRNARLVSLALVANFVVMPLGAFGIARLLRLNEALAAGLLVLGTAGGAPFLPKLAALAKGNVAFAVGLMVLLMVLTVGYMPLVLPMLLEGVSVDAAKIARSLILLMMLPLGVGLAVNARFGAAAARARPALDKTSNITLILVIALLVVTNFDKMLDVFGTRGILAGIVFILFGYAIGHLLGGPALDTRRVLALGTSQRNIAAALVVGEQNFTDPKVVLIVVIVAIIGLLILMPLSRALSRRG